MYFSAQIKKLQSRKIFLSFNALVKVKESKEVSWSEETEILTASRNGASFCLKQKCQVGQLVYLKMPMPVHLRAYDEDKESYGVWGIVQHCNKLCGEFFDEFHIGVAFIGQFPPQKYFDNPRQTYQICGMNENRFWNVAPTEKQFVSRKHLRFWVYIDLFLEVLDIEGNTLEQEKTVTENVSIRGAVTYSNMNVGVGDCLKVTCAKYDFYTIAVVRDRRSFTTNLSKIHLEFVEQGFPVEKIEASQQVHKKLAFFE